MSTLVKRKPIVNPAVAAQVARLSESHREWFEERAGMLEFGADMPQADAEAAALAQVIASASARSKG